MDMNSTKSKARTAGQLYLALALTGIFSLMYVPSTLIVFGDATAESAGIETDNSDEDFVKKCADLTTAEKLIATLEKNNLAPKLFNPKGKKIVQLLDYISES